jgi:MoaA/NifB/PqqE/SkfB family radical SAM enzyme
MPCNYITVDSINHINAELSNYCNAACPMCARFDAEQNLVKEITNNHHTTLDDIKNKIGDRVLKNLHIFRSCGNVGDGTMNPECEQIFEYVKSVNSTADLSINTNGGARNTDFYKELAKIGVRVIFSIDGLEDTNHLYRRNVKWDKMFENVKSFLDAGGVAYWDFLVFKHNQHQVETAEKLSKQLGFVLFNKKTTTRWDDFDKDGNWLERNEIKIDDYALEKPEDKIVQDVDNERDVKVQNVTTKKILCNSFANKNVEIFLHANGNVSPCCWLGDLKIHESKNIIKDYASVNIHHTPLQQILDGYYFNEIWKGIQGQVQNYKLMTCQNVCGLND